MSSMRPSGADFATAPAAIIALAPVRFSTMTDCPSAAFIGSHEEIPDRFCRRGNARSRNNRHADHGRRPLGLVGPRAGWSCRRGDHRKRAGKARLRLLRILRLSVLQLRLRARLLRLCVLARLLRLLRSAAVLQLLARALPLSGLLTAITALTAQ